MAGGNDLTLKLGFDINKFSADLNKAQKSFANFSIDLKSAFTKIAAGFSAVQIGRFVLDVSRLAGEAEGVKAAFDRLPNSVQLMNQLKEATGGTVSELELMKRSVMASNFDISLKALPQLLEFATLRARQTGQSVDYLVDSIVTGIGRKSKLILDNLGISAVQLTEALGGASAASSTIGEVAEAVGRIASENMKTMGKLTDDAAVRGDRLKASWDNLKVSLGNLANNSGLSSLIQKTEQLVNLINIGLGGKTNRPFADMQNGLKLLNQSIAEGGALSSSQFAEFLKQTNDLAKQLGGELVRLADNTGKAMYVFRKNKIEFVNAAETEEQIRNIKFLQEQIKSLEEEITLTTDPLLIKNWQGEIKSLQKEIDVLLGKVKKMKLDFSGLAGKGVDLPKIKERDFSLFDPMVKKMLDGFANDTEALRKQTDIINEARASLESFGITSEKGLQQASEAFSKFLKDKDMAAFQTTLQGIVDKEMAVKNMILDMGSDLGNAFGDLISGAQNFAGAMAKMAARVIDSLERVVLANMLANSSKFGLPGILLAAAGFGVVKSLFNNIARENRSTSGISGSKMGGGGNYLMAAPVLEARVSGKDLQFVLKNQSTYDSRVKTT